MIRTIRVLPPAVPLCDRNHDFAAISIHTSQSTHRVPLKWLLTGGNPMKAVLFLLLTVALSPSFAKTKTKLKAKPSAAPLKEMSARELITKGEEQMRGRTAQASLQMLIKRPSYTRRLSLRSWSVGNDRALVEILNPPKEEGVASLRNQDQMWNYLPKADQVVRVPTSLMLQSWMGSDFTNDDLMKASSLSRDYTHKKIKEETIDGEKTALIDCMPNPGAPVVWGKVRHWARLKDGLPLKQEFFDESKKLVRTILFSRFKKMDDRLIPTIVKVTKADSNESTSIIYSKIVYDRTIPEEQFDRDSIRHISQKGKAITAGWFMAPRLK